MLQVLVLALGYCLNFAVFFVWLDVHLQQLLILLQYLPVEKLKVVPLARQHLLLVLKLFIAFPLCGDVSAHLLKLYYVIRYFFLYLLPQLVHQVLLYFLDPPFQYFHVWLFDHLQFSLQSGDWVMEIAVFSLQLLIFCLEHCQFVIQRCYLREILLLYLVQFLHHRRRRRPWWRRRQVLQLQIGFIGRLVLSHWSRHRASKCFFLGLVKVFTGDEFELALYAEYKFLEILLRRSSQV